MPFGGPVVRTTPFPRVQHIQHLGCGRRARVRLSDGSSRVTLVDALDMAKVRLGSTWFPEYDGSGLVLRDPIDHDEDWHEHGSLLWRPP